MALPITNRRLSVSAPARSPAAAAFAPMPGASVNANAPGQTSANALYGDFLGGSQTPLPAPNVRPPAIPPPPPTGVANVYPNPQSVPGALPPTPTVASAAFGAPLQAPGQNMANPGYGEQAIEHTQNRLLNDPSAGLLNDQYQQTQSQTPGEDYISDNLGTLQGPGQGEQYWNQVQGSFNDPFAGEQFARQATQNMSPTGPAGAFFDQTMGQYGDFTGNQGPGNTQQQYGQSSGQLAGGTQGEQGLGAIAGQYDSTGRYTDPNLAAGQYSQTQGAFGDLPIAEFDPFYDRARQLGVQSYNQNAAGRGVYGSSEALSGVGNVITDIEAQRANRSFDAEMQRSVEQRNRQQLLGEQARMGDLSSLGAFGANLSGAETFGNLNNMQGRLELERNELLGNMANQADTQALGVQSENRAGVEAFGNLAGEAGRQETDRYRATTGAMDAADRTGLERTRTGADIAFRGDENARADYTAEANAAQQVGALDNERTRLGAEIADTASDNDLARLDSFNRNSQGAENQRQNRVQSEINATFQNTQSVLNSIGQDINSLLGGSQQDFEQKWEATILPAAQAAGMSQKQIDQLHTDMGALIKGGASG